MPTSPLAPPPFASWLSILSCRGEDGVVSRLHNGHFGHLFSRKPLDLETSAEHADTMVNLFTLAATLLLTCPYALMGSLQTDSWTALKSNLATCASNPWTGATPWDAAEVNRYIADVIYPSVANSLLAAIYFSLFTIVVSCVYYMTRPNGSKDATDSSKKMFATWWQRGRALLFCICCGMTASLVAVLTFSNVYYTNFVTPSELFCSQYRQRWFNYIGAASSLVCATLSLLYVAI